VALILDLAVLAIAAVVVGSLALLSWTFAVSTVHAVERGRRQVAAAGATTARAEAAVRAAATRASRDQGHDAAHPVHQTDGEQTEA